MTSIFDQFLFSISITGPICLMLIIGVLLRRLNLINDQFNDVASKLVFQLTLPALLFLGIVQSSNTSTESTSLIAYGVSANIAFFILVSIVTKWMIRTVADQGVVIQGSFRANTAIIGLAYMSNAYGDQGMATAALYVAAMTLSYNILAVIALTQKSDQKGIKAYQAMLLSILKNPLVIAIILALFVHELHIPIPNVVLRTGQYFADMTLPLALLCTGGSLNIKELRHDSSGNFIATANKLIIGPALITLGGYMLGFKGIELSVIFFMTSAPTAAASYVMARAMGGNAILAANIIALTTVVSIVTTTLGIIFLSHFGLM